VIRQNIMHALLRLAHVFNDNLPVWTDFLRDNHN